MGFGGEEDVYHPKDVEEEDPLKREEGLQSRFGCKESRPGDEDGREVDYEFDEGGGVRRVGENPDQERDEENHLLVRDCAWVNGVREETDESQEFDGGELVLPPFFGHPRKGEEEDDCDNDRENVGCGGADEKLEENGDVRDRLIGFRVPDQLVIPLDWPGRQQDERKGDQC